MDDFVTGLFGEIVRSRRRAADKWKVTADEADEMDRFLERLNLSIANDIPMLWPLQKEHFTQRFAETDDAWMFYRSLDFTCRQRLIILYGGDMPAIRNAEDLFYGISSYIGSGTLKDVFSEDLDNIIQLWDRYCCDGYFRLWKFYHGLSPDNKKQLLEWYNSRTYI